MVNDNFLCIKEVTKTVHIELPTACTSNEISGISDVLESWKRQYIQQLNAIVVSFRDVSLTSLNYSGYIKLDCPIVHCDVTATFELFYPTVGSVLKGKINRVCHDYIGCLVHNTINVTIENRPNDLPSEVKNFIALDRYILFEITRLDYKRRIIRVTGKLTQKCIDLMKESDMFDVKNDESNYTSEYSREDAENRTRHIVYSDEENNSVTSDKTANDINQYSSPVISSCETVPLNKTKKAKKKKRESIDSKNSPKKKQKAKNQSVSNELDLNEINLFADQTDLFNYSTPNSEQDAVHTKKRESIDSKNSPKKKQKAKNQSVSNELDLNEINLFSPHSEQDAAHKKKHRKNHDKVNTNLLSQDLFADSSHNLPLNVSSIKKEPLDKTKKAKKRKRALEDTNSSPKKKKKTKVKSSLNDLDVMKAEYFLKFNQNDESNCSSLDSTEYAASLERDWKDSDQVDNNLISDKVSSDYHSLLTIGDIKTEPLDKTKKARKRTRESGDTGSPAKKKKKSDNSSTSSKIKDKTLGKKKKKDKSKKNSKRDKKKKLKDKVISTKKKSHGIKINSKKRNKDKKEKSLTKKDKSKTEKKTKKDKSKSKKGKSKNKK